MIAKTDVVKVYETLLSIPGMNDSVKLNFQTSRKNILLLHRIIERGIYGTNMDEKVEVYFESVSKEVLKELEELGTEMLNKAGLSEMNEKLKAL